MQLKVQKLHPDAKLPTKSYSSDSGWDVYAVDISFDENFIEYDTGIAIQPPDGYDVKIFPRSSVSKTHLMLANGVGVLDESYRGPVKLRFKRINMSLQKLENIYDIGDKIGQLVLQKREDAELIEVDKLDDTDRGEGGFGSTGK